MAHSTDVRPAAGASAAAVLALRVTATLTVLVLLAQFATAGELLGDQSFKDAHETGALVLHVLTGLAMVAAALVWRLRGRAPWPTLLAAVVFALTFVQASVGSTATLWLHVPGAMLLTTGAVWLAVGSFSGPRARG